MIVWIKDWAEGIVISVIIATIIELLLPDNNKKKYINTVIGIYILFSIISPFISKFTGQSINIENYINEDTVTATNDTINNIELLENNSNVEDIYIRTLKEDISNTLNKSGFIVKTLELKINMNSKNNYGEILGIYLSVFSRNENINIDKVNEIKVDLSENTNRKINSISEEELNKAKEILIDTYGMDKSKIHINEE